MRKIPLSPFMVTSPSRVHPLTCLGSPPDNLDSEFDKLLAAKDVMARVRSMPSAHVVFLAQYTQSRMVQEMNEGQFEIEAELQVCFMVFTRSRLKKNGRYVRSERSAISE